MPRIGRTIVAAIVLTAAVAGCSTSTGAPATGPAATNATTPAPTATSVPSPSATVAILEDAGLEIPLAAGSYTSRLFKPTVTFQLPEGWYRRDAGGERNFNLRQGRPDAETGHLTFIGGIDYLQCGAGDLVEKPTTKVIVDAITASTTIGAEAPTELTVGDRPAIGVWLPGGGEPMPQEIELEKMLDYGCILSVGEPFPAESLWIVLASDLKMQLVLLDVDGTTVILRGQVDDAAAILDLLPDITFE